jgi:hypothetical protein
MSSSKNDQPEINMMSLVDNKEKEKVNRPKIDFTKVEFTQKEKELVRKEVEVIKEKYPNYIPIIVRPKDRSIELVRYKFLVGAEVTIGQLLCIIRKKIKNLQSSEALFLLVNNILVPSTHSLSLVYKQQLDEETNMLFFTLCKESTFGNLVKN